jgi:hypothetical protein
MAYSTEEHVFTVKEFYQASSVMTVQTQFHRKFKKQYAPIRPTISHLVQKFELTGSVCDNKKGVVRMYRSAYTQDNDAHIHEVLLWSPRISVTECSQLLGINKYHHVIGYNISLQNPSGTDAHCSLETAESCVAV